MKRIDFRRLARAALSRRLCLALGLICWACFAAEPAPPPAPDRAEETNAQDTLRSLLHVQEQLHATQLAIERNRRETDAAAARSAETLDTRLQGIAQALAAQRAQELETMQNANRVMLIVAESFAGLGFVALLLTAYFQWRIISRLADISAALPFTRALGAAPTLEVDDTHRLGPGPAPESNQRLLGALDRLEQRILELEHTTRLPLKEGEPAPRAGALPDAASDTDPAKPGGPDAAQITVLLGKGQSLLNLDHAEEALACFDAVLALDANHPEALVKKGAALERLRKLDEAVACYDRAIAADGSLTVAYLYKGGLFNRMERFSEALECYEQALRTQETRRG